MKKRKYNVIIYISQDIFELLVIMRIRFFKSYSRIQCGKLNVQHWFTISQVKTLSLRYCYRILIELIKGFSLIMVAIYATLSKYLQFINKLHYLKFHYIPVRIWFFLDDSIKKTVFQVH